MATPEDLAANADYIRMADKYVEVCKAKRLELPDLRSGVLTLALRCLAEPTTTTTPTSSSSLMLPSVWAFTPSGLDGECSCANFHLTEPQLTHEQGSRLRKPQAARIARRITTQDCLHRSSWLGHEIAR